MPSRFLLLALAAAAVFVGLSMVPSNRSTETEAIQLHLEHVESHLRRTAVSHLSEVQRQRRAELLDHLHDYARAGVFPKNDTHPGRRVPVFVDLNGTPCAVGWLLLQTGEEELVQAVVEADNNVRVPKLANNVEFRHWLDQHGLALAEAAWIQPTYRGEPSGGDDRYQYESLALVASAATAGVAMWSALTRPEEREPDLAGWLSLGLGLADLGIAAVGVGQNQDDWALLLSGGVGIIGSLAGLSSIIDEGDGEAGIRVSPFVFHSEAGGRPGLQFLWRW